MLANNRIANAGYGYDAAGNMTLDGTDSVSATFDAENRIATAGKGGLTTAYIYDVDGNRVEKLTPPPPATPTDGTIYWYMAPGIVAESDLSGVTKAEYVFCNGERVARRDSSVRVEKLYWNIYQERSRTRCLRRLPAHM